MIGRWAWSPFYVSPIWAISLYWDMCVCFIIWSSIILAGSPRRACGGRWAFGLRPATHKCISLNGDTPLDPTKSTGGILFEQPRRGCQAISSACAALCNFTYRRAKKRSRSRAVISKNKSKVLICVWFVQSCGQFCRFFFRFRGVTYINGDTDQGRQSPAKCEFSPPGRVVARCYRVDDVMMAGPG